MANISFNSVSKKYGKNITAVSDISFEIKAGELLILCGPSGCGKSTVLRMLAGLEDISSGEVRIDDVVINQVAPKDRDIAMVFQNYTIYPHMTVFDNIAFSLKLRKVSKDEIKNRVESTAETLGLKHLLDRKPKPYPAVNGKELQWVVLLFANQQFIYLTNPYQISMPK